MRIRNVPDERKTLRELRHEIRILCKVTGIPFPPHFATKRETIKQLHRVQAAYRRQWSDTWVSGADAEATSRKWRSGRASS